MIQTVHSDCLDHMRSMAAGSVDAIVSDPPYGLSFMGKDWDHGVPGKHFWEEALRVAKPGAHLLAFGGTRTFHRLAVAIEDAGWEMRDTLMYVYGSGFPKSHNLKRVFCSCNGEGKQKAKHDVRPMHSTDLSEALAEAGERGQVLFANVPEQGSQEHGTTRPEPEPPRGEQSGVEGRGHGLQEEGELREHPLPEGPGMGTTDGPQGWVHNGASLGDGADLRSSAIPNGSSPPQESQPYGERTGEPGTLANQHGPQAGGRRVVCSGCGKPVAPFDVSGYGTALKPAFEPIIMARKPFKCTVGENVRAHGTGALNIDGCRVEGIAEAPGTTPPTPMNGYHRFAERTPFTPNATGRWPANVIHDGSEEVLKHFPKEAGSYTGTPHRGDGRTNKGRAFFGGFLPDKPWEGIKDNSRGSAARFFKTCEHDEFPLLLCDAKAIFGAWKTSPANTAESPSHQPSPSADFVRDLVLFAEHCGATLQSRRWTEHFTNATPIELSDLCTLVTMAILFTEARSWRVSQPAKHTLPNSRVSIAETNEQTGITTITIDRSTSDGFAEVATFGIMPLNAVRGEAASASRLVYCAKASKADRDEGLEHMPEVARSSEFGQLHPGTSESGNTTGNYLPRRNVHPTVKPTELMRYLCRLVTPPNGVVFDPFMGSGSTGKAAVLEGFSFIGCDLQEEYVKIASARIEHAERQRIRDEGLFAA